MSITFSGRGWMDYEWWIMNSDRKSLKRLFLIINDIARNGFDGIGKPEPLRGNLSGWWSRRIDDANRVVYRINNGAVEILQCRGHYGE